MGSETSVGANGTGEACKLRVVQDDRSRGLTRLHLYCDGWTVSSGTLYRFRVARDTTPERLLTDSTFQKGYETRLAGCGAVEATRLGDGAPAALRQCARMDRGWPVVVMAAIAGGRGYALETFPTNVRVMETAVGALQGRAVPGAAREGTLSAAARRAETIVGASGKMIGVQDIGAAEALWLLGKLQYRSGNYAAGQATFSRLLELETQLQAEFPRYARLTAERPLTADEVKALLRPDEALVAFLPGNQVMYVALVRRDGVHVHRARIGRSALEADVKALRESLDLSADGTRVFDVALAQRLHALLLGPLTAPLAGVRHLLTVPAGPLLSLPLGVLVTRASPAAPDYRTVPFLAADVAISVLPSVAALRDLRAVAGRSSAPEPFLAFADPAFAGAQQDRRAVGNVANLCRDGAVDAATLRTLPRIPDSADEVRKIAAALGARGDSVVLGADATEARVRTTDLSRYRVLAFATHGLLPGELQCQAEPALALTPPSAPTANEDGLLDASEVAALKLDADWVVLSACNTAGPDGSLGGESLSGLTRAFFYAGARTLLVSQWTVASGPTVD